MKPILWSRNKYVPSLESLQLTKGYRNFYRKVFLGLSKIVLKAQYKLQNDDWKQQLAKITVGTKNHEKNRIAR